MASHLLTKSITWSKSCQSRRSLESWNRCTCPSCPWLPFLIGQVCSQVWCRPYFGANFGFFELRIRTFPWSPGIVEVGTFYPLTFKVGSKYPNILRESSSLKLKQLWSWYYPGSRQNNMLYFPETAVCDISPRDTKDISTSIRFFFSKSATPWVSSKQLNADYWTFLLLIWSARKERYCYPLSSGKLWSWKSIS